jgi:hypothetical protein
MTVRGTHMVSHILRRILATMPVMAIVAPPAVV